MSLKEVLEALNKNACESIAAPDIAVMRRAVMEIKRSGIVDQSLQVGETIPDFALPDNAAGAASIYELLNKKGPVVINFFRGYWCPFCVAHLEAFEAAVKEFSELNISLVVISPDSVDAASRNSPSLIAVQDADNVIAKEFQIVYTLNDDMQALYTRWENDIPGRHNSNHWELPIPATYYVDANRRIKHRFINPDFRERVDPQDLINVLKQEASG